ncbi:MAG: YIP1 family protein [Gemmatimonadales bacterium]|nr:YIP1 family protein [Gemmatimonadales bacterium]
MNEDMEKGLPETQSPLSDGYQADPPLKPGEDGFLGRLIDLVVKPGRLMVHVEAVPRWWQAGLLLFLLMAAFSWLIMPVSGPEQMELMRDSKLGQLMPPGEWEKAYAEALDPDPTKRILQSLGAGLSTWVMVLVLSFVLGFFARMSGGQGSFKQALGVVHWASLIPFGMVVIIKAPLILMTESLMQVNIGLAALLPDADPGSVLFQILVTYGDFFNWWGLAILVIGFRQVFRMSSGAAAVSVLLPWALLVAIPVGINLAMM